MISRTQLANEKLSTSLCNLLGLSYLIACGASPNDKVVTYGDLRGSGLRRPPIEWNHSNEMDDKVQ